MKAYKANIIHCSENMMAEYHPQSWLSVGADGKIIEISKNIPEAAREKVDLGDKLILPGFIDTHTHLPQYSFAGLGNLPLLPWLEKYTFPQEMRFADRTTASRLSDIFFKELLANGTTTVMAYATAHKQATEAAFESAAQAGIRAHIGQVWMQNNAPEEMLLDADEAFRQSEELIRWYHGKNQCEFVVTPRFAVSCPMPMLQAAAELRKQHNLLLQSHLSENADEIQTVLRLFPGLKTYTEVYERAGVLSQKTLMGHSIYLSNEERGILKKTGTVLVHCPTSNRFLSSGIMPLRKYVTENQRVALGTDVAAGYSLSMLHEMKEAIESSKQYTFVARDQKSTAISPAEALALATIKGAHAIGKGDTLGNFQTGKQADFVVIDDQLTHPEGPDSMHYNSLEERLSRLIYRFEKRMMQKVFIAGRPVYEQAS